jgi:hypothetical protein
MNARWMVTVLNGLDSRLLFAIRRFQFFLRLLPSLHSVVGPPELETLQEAKGREVDVCELRGDRGACQIVQRRLSSWVRALRVARL